ncbi:OB-fold nucleic acid binding domain-containing protein [Streptomyces noursei]|nr:OB-fold nucleic acid binding domain-containing protein [Streptomyces noursei]
MERVAALDEPLKKILGGTTAKVLAEHLGLETVGDLLHHYPRRYAERGELTRLSDLPLDEHVTVVAQVADARVLTFNHGRGQRLEVTLTDGSGRLQLVFFGKGIHKPQKDLLPGRRAMFAGKVSVFNRKLQLAHPEYELLDRDADNGVVDAFANQLMPIYPACQQMASWKIAKAVDAVLPSAQDAVDPLPPGLREGRALIPLTEALLKIHRPGTKADIADARARLKWDEAFVLQVALARRRFADAQLPAVPRRLIQGGILDAFDARLPFTLTEGQTKVSREIFDDLATEHPMHRLLQGEVGSGKAQPLDALVLTPRGFRPMGEMAPGTEVVVPSGGTALVDGVFPQGEREVWRLVLSDGSTVECDDEHLWIVSSRATGERVLTTRALRADLLDDDGRPRWSIAPATPVDLDDGGPRPLDAYELGRTVGAGGAAPAGRAVPTPTATPRQGPPGAAHRPVGRRRRPLGTDGAARLFRAAPAPLAADLAWLARSWAARPAAPRRPAAVTTSRSRSPRKDPAATPSGAPSWPSSTSAAGPSSASASRTPPTPM